MFALGVSLEVDPVSLLIHAGLFFVVLAVLSRFLLKPVSRVLAERDDAITARQARAVTMMTEALQLELAYRQRIESVKHEARELKEGLQREGFTRAATIMEQARAQAAARLEQAKRELQRAADQAKTVLQVDARQFARVFAERILERSEQAREEIRRDNAAVDATARKANSS